MQYVLVSLGVNDIDDIGGVEVAKKLSDLTEDIHMIYPNAKIIVSELTPRKNARDNEVIECNKPLVSHVKSKEYMYFAKQSNLRDPDYTFFDDAKHIKKTTTGRYASNLKIALRKAYGIEDPREQNSDSYNRSWQQQWTSNEYRQNQNLSSEKQDHFGMSRKRNHNGDKNDDQTRKTIEDNYKMDLKRRLLQLLS